MFIWPDDNAPDGATWTGSFNQGEWDAYLKDRKAKADAGAAKKAAPAKSAANQTTAKDEK